MAHGAPPPLLLSLLAASALVVGLAWCAEAEASHVRGGTVSWRWADAGTVEVVGGLAFQDNTVSPDGTRCEGSIGRQFACMKAAERGPDGSAAGPIVGADGAPIRVAVGSSPVDLSYRTCCWLAGAPTTHHNNPNAFFSLPAEARPGAGSPPAFDWTPVLGCPAGQPCHFRLRAVDPDGDNVTYGLAPNTTWEPFHQPPGLQLDPATGEVVWPAPADPGPGYDAWSVGFTATDGTHTVATMFLLELEAPPCGWTPPALDSFTADGRRAPRTEVRLQWAAVPSRCAPEAVELERSPTWKASDHLPHARLPGTATGLDDPLPECDARAYRIRIVNQNGPGAWRMAGAGIGHGDVPSAPHALAGTTLADGTIRLDWSPGPATPALKCPVLGYEVVRTSGAQPVRLGATEGLDLTDGAPRACQSNAYTVVAVNAVGPSAPSAVQAVAGHVPAPPPPYVAATRTGPEALDPITVHWGAVDHGCPLAQYEVWRDGTRIARVHASRLQATDTTPTLPCQSVLYEVRAIDATGVLGRLRSHHYRHEGLPTPCP